MSEHPVFAELKMQRFDSKDLDSILSAEGLKILFLWGYNCPNCDVAKNSLFQEKETFLSYPFRWYQCNVYEDFDVSTRFGLHGIPVFLFFKGHKSIGRVTSYPGFEPFRDVLQKISST